MYKSALGNSSDWRWTYFIGIIVEMLIFNIVSGRSWGHYFVLTMLKIKCSIVMHFGTGCSCHDRDNNYYQIGRVEQGRIRGISDDWHKSKGAWSLRNEGVYIDFSPISLF